VQIINALSGSVKFPAVLNSNENAIIFPSCSFLVARYLVLWKTTHKSWNYNVIIVTTLCAIHVKYNGNNSMLLIVIVKNHHNIKRMFFFAEGGGAGRRRGNDESSSMSQK